MKTKAVLTLALALGTVTVAAPSFADSPAPPPAGDDGAPPPPPGDDDGGPHGPLGHMLKKLGLSADQQTQIDAIRKKYQGKLKDLFPQIKTEREALGTLMTAYGPVDPIRAQHKKVEALQGQVADQRFEMMYEMAGVLTPAQRTQMHDMMKAGDERWRHHKHEKKD